MNEGCKEPTLGCVITAFGENRRKLEASYNSARIAGYSDIVIALAGCSAEYKKSIERYAGHVILTAGTSNDQWIAGVEELKTEYVHILHDGDVVLPETLRMLDYSSAEFDIAIFQAVNYQQPQQVHSELCVPGVKPRDFIRFFSNPAAKAVTPCRGIFRRRHLLDALQDFENYYDKSLLVNHSLVIGPDMHIWLYNIDNCKIITVPHPLVAIDVEESTTVSAEGTYKLERLYNLYKSRVGLFPRKDYVVVLYTAGKYKEAANSVLMSTYGDKILLDTQYDSKLGKNYIASSIWLEGLLRAHNLGYTYMLYAEEDCLVKPKYDELIFNEFCSSDSGGPNYKIHPDFGVLQYGHIMVWGMHNCGRFSVEAMSNLVAHHDAIPYCSESGSPAVYCNGALCLYNVPFHYGVIYHEYSRHLRTSGPNCTAFDLYTGYVLFDIYKEHVQHVVVNNPHVYSTCDFNWVGREGLKKMFEREEIYGIHKNPYLVF